MHSPIQIHDSQYLRIEVVSVSSNLRFEFSKQVTTYTP
jgi:hypothetical protein